ncbi:MAG: SoxR reducing system RseC family protein [Pseudomonadales bacterium]|nr:SoxR reducing system RseC family protein [Pseudomonadales bacterium]
MIEQSAEIVEVGADSIWIKAPRQTACGSCAAQSSCGQNLWSRFFEDRQHPVEVKADPNKYSDLKVGNQVVIGVPESIVVNGSLLVYIMPLVTMLVAAVAGQSVFGQSDGVTIFCAAIGLVAGFLFMRTEAKKNSNNPDLQPVLLQALDSGCPPDNISVKNLSAE